MALRTASTATKRLDIGDGDWLEVREEISKREMKELVSFLPDRIVDEQHPLVPTEGVQLQSGLFRILVTNWSADMPPTVESYEGLDPEDAGRIDTALAQHFTALSPDRAEGKADTTSRGRRR